MARGALSGVRVIELGTAIAAPMCGMLLGEMGAEVIKIETPGRGDDARNWGDKVGGESLYFFHYNKNKKSCALNLKDERGREALKRLVARSDVLIENFRPGVMDRLGLSYEKLREVNPRLVYCSVSGFGQWGPYSQLGGYDVIIQGMSGLMSITGEPDGEPLRVGLPITDILAALYAAYSVALTLFWREKTGEGQRIDISLFEAAVGAMGQWISIYSGTGRVPKRFGNRYPLISPYEPIKTRDGYVIVAIGNEDLWRRFCKLIGREDLASDPRFATNQDRIKPENRSALLEILYSVMSGRDSRDWLKELWREGIPAGPINTVDKLLEDEHLRERGMFVNISHPTIGNITAVNVVPKLSAAGGSVKAPSPLLGQHTREVLKLAGYSDAEIDELVKAGVAQEAG